MTAQNSTSRRVGSDGIPLFAEELGRVLRGESGAALASVPTTLHDLLTMRLDATADAKLTAQVAATIGHEFELPLLERLVPPETIERHRDILTRAGIWIGDPDATALAFRHSLLADAAYDSQVRERKRAVHLQIADVLASDFPDIAAAEPHRVAQHLEEGGRSTEAAGMWLQAGMTTAGRGAPVEAVGQFQRGITLLDRIDDPQIRNGLELGLRLGFGASLASTVGYGSDAVQASFERAQALCRELGNPPELFPAVWGSWTFYLIRADYDMAQRLADDCRAMAASSLDEALAIEAAAAIGMSAFYRGDLRSAATEFHLAIDLFDTTSAVSAAQQFQHPVVAASANLALVEWLLGRPVQAKSAVDRAMELARTCEPRLRMFARGYAATFGAALGSLLGDGEYTLRYAQDAIDVCVEYGSQVFLAGGEMYKGYAQCLLGDTDEGIARLESAADGYVLTGARLLRPYHLSMVATARRMAGDLDGAVEALDEAVELAAKPENTPPCRSCSNSAGDGGSSSAAATWPSRISTRRSSWRGGPVTS